MSIHQLNFCVVVPWHSREQIDKFLSAWGVDCAKLPSWLLLVEDPTRTGCAATKNRGIAEAIARKFEYICIIDDDCYPKNFASLDSWARDHIEALQDVECPLFEVVTDPPSRGTPYFKRTMKMRVAASMGFWHDIPDYDAPHQLCYHAKPMQFRPQLVFGKYFPLCGMNLAFRASEWPWCQFIDVPRFDDIWGGFLWQRQAYAQNKCFNLNGPAVRHVRQSKVFQNLKIEAENLERNEELWQQIASGPLLPYEEMLSIYHLKKV